MKKIIIAVDGYAATGKSTLAKMIAAHMGYSYINSGMMFRVLTYYAIKKKIVDDNRFNQNKLVNALNNIDLHFICSKSAFQPILSGEMLNAELLHPKVTKYVSRVAQISQVRSYLLDKQRTLAHNSGVVMDGRDIGTVVFPKAEAKFFFYGDVAIRAKRRYKELNPNKDIILKSLNKTEKELIERDEKDKSRNIAPLIQAKDAIALNINKLGIKQVFDFMMDIINKKLQSV